MHSFSSRTTLKLLVAFVKVYTATEAPSHELKIGYVFQPGMLLGSSYVYVSTFGSK